MGTKVEFGNPNRGILLLSETAIEEMRLKLDYATQQHMLRYDLMPLSVSINLSPPKPLNIAIPESNR
jgi:hypothetical protein